jgi:SAM-dependent methyltransferase
VKRCLACEARFESQAWRCTACGWEATSRDGIEWFAPELVASEEGFDPSHFETLAGLEEKNFWFRARNRLISWGLKRDFPGKRNLLEIGCGTGYVLAGLRATNPGLALTGSDLHPQGLALARHRVDATFQQMDGRRIPYAEEFDVVGAFDVIEHIPEDGEVLQQMRQATRPGGGIMLTVPQHPWLWSEFDETSHHVRRYRRPELVAKVRDAGFTVRRVTSFVGLLLPAMALGRLGRRRERRDLAAELTCPPAVNSAFERILSFELSLIRRGRSLPAGGSLFLTATRND